MLFFYGKSRPVILPLEYDQKSWFDDLDEYLHSQIMDSTLVYSKRAHHAMDRVYMNALIYLSDKQIDLNDSSDKPIRLVQ